MNRGKSLEKRFQRWMKELDIYCQRFYDSGSMGRVGSARPADFWVWIPPKLILVECKEIKSSKSLNFSNIRPSQYKAGLLAKKYRYTYVLTIQICGEVYITPMVDFMRYMRKTTKKSISYEDIKSIGIKVNNKKSLLKILSNL